MVVRDTKYTHTHTHTHEVFVPVNRAGHRMIFGYTTKASEAVYLAINFETNFH